ncbi:hypothetical protein [Effusibacillus dendaii]|uniref:Uncharacterized protein n=1 Tax=Effusibacillus dendaii TaxID=2743772 RepID=A0A7I8D9J3_9BACL|nr:hypothetical protein [Effusibacillus dendaii]BCJ86818.1 hypothetical protein skT53_18030 [Effusibacillus dendaii]
MEAKMEEMRSELAKLQIEVTMLRQMMGSLVRTEQYNLEMMQSETKPETYGIVGQVMPNEQATISQLEKMKQLGSELQQHMQHLSQLLGAGENHPYETVMSDPDSPQLKDPMQRTF